MERFLKARENEKKAEHLISEQFIISATSILQLYVGGGFSESFVTHDEITDCVILKYNALEADSQVW